MKKTYVFREAWPYHFDPLFDWISALPICSSAKILLARLHNSNRTLERVKRGRSRAIYFSLGAAGDRPNIPPGQFGSDQMASRTGILRSGQLRLWFVDTSRAGVLPRDSLHAFH